MNFSMQCGHAWYMKCLFGFVHILHFVHYYEANMLVQLKKLFYSY